MRHGMSDQMRVPIVMLQSFASKGGASGGRSDQEATYARIATLGEEVRDPARTIRKAVPIARP